jgi:excisionase family DNA binding protein
MNAALTVDDSAFLTVGQVAGLLQISPRQVQRLVRPSAGKDRILAFKVGSIIRIRRQALEAWIKAREGRAA